MNIILILIIKNRRACIAYLENDKIKYIFEICDTNKTDENNRPEPWFEIDVRTILKLYTDSNNKKELEIPCIRKIKCKKCFDKKEQKK